MPNKEHRCGVGRERRTCVRLTVSGGEDAVGSGEIQKWM